MASGPGDFVQQRKNSPRIYKHAESPEHEKTFEICAREADLRAERAATGAWKFVGARKRS
jgi:hypothetical protein